LIKAFALAPLVWISALPAAMATDLPVAFNLSEPAAGVFVHLGRQVAPDAPGHDDIANIGFVVGSACVAVIDTGGSMRTGRALHSAIRKHTRLPICYVINTHVHFDHVLGNAAFKDDHPSFIGNANLAAAIKRSQDFFITHFGDDLGPGSAQARIIGPDRLVEVERELTLELGGRRLTLRAWPPAHTDCDLTVEDDRTGALWTGDLLFRERLPALDGSARGWVAALDELARWQIKLAIPGHGSLTRDFPAALLTERRYLQALIEGTRSELEQGKSMQAALGEVANAERPGWLLWDQVHPRNVARVYQELEWE
jgi:quinoprotein relay system zinc metallohydrolase 2